MCGESWHAAKGSLTHRPSFEGWAPGVCVCVVVCVFGRRVCVWWFGGKRGGKGLALGSFIASICFFMLRRVNLLRLGM